MAEVVNLRLARKRKARADAAEAADRNRAAHGRTKAERGASDAARVRADRTLDGHEVVRDAPQDG